MLDKWLTALPDEARAQREWRLVLLATLGVCLFIVACSIGTLPILGDEAQHFRRAIVYWETGFPLTRATHDTAYPATGFSAVRYYDAALWHMVLVLLWRVAGHPSLLVAQVYHLTYFFALATFAYLVGRELYGRRGGLWAWALVLTIPMNLMFGMVFYLEVPVLAWAAMATYCILRGRAIFLGLALIGMFLTKGPSAAVLTPPLLIGALLVIGETWRQRIFRTLLAAAVLFVMFMPDMHWRTATFGHAIMFHDQTRFELPFHHHVESAKKTAIPFDIADLMVDLRLFGVSGIFAVLVGIGLGVAYLARDSWRVLRTLFSAGPVATIRSTRNLCTPEAWVVALPMITYVLGFLIMLRGAWDVRYFHPAVFFAAVLAGGRLAAWRPFEVAGRYRVAARWGAGLLVLAMLGQLVTVPPYLHIKRQLPPEVAAGFEWIKANTPPKARFLYLETNLVVITGRPLIWAAAMPRYLFNVPEPEQARILYHLGVQYIAIHPTRQADKSFDPEVEISEYPKPWIRSLVGRPYIVRVYPPEEPDSLEGRFLIFKLDPTKIPKEWIQDARPEASNPFWGEDETPAGQKAK